MYVRNGLKLSLIGFLVLVIGCQSSQKQGTVPSEWQENYILANDIRIHYWRTGGNKPVIVMAHGSSDNGLCWTNFAKEFTDDYDVIMFDARGHGLTDPPSKTDLMDAQAEDFAAFIKALKLEKPIIMGHSMGSASAAWMAAKYPDIPRAVILEDPRLAPRPASWNNRSTPDAVKKRRLNILSKNNSTFNEIYLKGLKNTPHWGESELSFWAPSKLLHHPNSAFRRIGDHPKMAELFPKIIVPTLILKADDQGEIREINFKVSKLLKKGKIVHIQGAGHNIRRDQKELTIKETKKFLNSLN